MQIEEVLSNIQLNENNYLTDPSTLTLDGVLIRKNLHFNRKVKMALN